MKRIKLAMLALAVFPASLALAQAPEAPTPPKENANLDGYAGSWTCTGSVPESPMGPARKTMSNVKIHKDLDGMWYSGRVEEPRTKENPHSFAGAFHMGYDAAAKNYVIMWVDNMGGWAAQTSPGWEGDRQVWTGDGSMDGKKITARDTFSKQGAELKHLGELQMDGKWIIIQDEVCKKAAAKK